MPSEEIAVMTVEPDVLFVKVGTLSIYAEKSEPGRAIHGFGTKILFDGKEPPIDVTKLVLTVDCDDVIRVELHGYPRAAK